MIHCLKTCLIVDGDLGEPNKHMSASCTPCFYNQNEKTMTAPFQAPLEQGVEKIVVALLLVFKATSLKSVVCLRAASLYGMH